MDIPQGEFDSNRLYQVYSEAGLDVEMDDDGDVRVEVGGGRVRARALDDRPFFLLSGALDVKPTATRLQVLELCNRINNEVVMVRACCPRESPQQVVYLDHFATTEGGISGREVVELTRLFVAAASEAVACLDKDGVLE